MTVILKAKDSRLKITKENWDQLSDNEALREFYTLEFWLPAHEKEMTKSQARRGWHLYDELSEYMASRGLISINPNIVYYIFITTEGVAVPSPPPSCTRKEKNMQISTKLPTDFIKKAKELADQQYYPAVEFGNTDGCIGFPFQGQWIIHPWMDQSGRFELPTEKAIELYGKENFERFCISIVQDSNAKKVQGYDNSLPRHTGII